MKKIVIAFLLIPFLFVFCGKSPTEPDDSNGDSGGNTDLIDISEMKFENVTPAHEKPSTVQFFFTLRNQDDHSIVFTEEQLHNSLEIDITENDDSLDYNETEPIIHTADQFGLELVVVLDFTKSIAEIESAETVMIEGTKSLIDILGEQHKIGILEFHDNHPDNNYSVIQPLTADKNMAEENLDLFLENDIYNGFSLCWDAVYNGLELFENEPEQDIVRILVFLSDGLDTNSSNQPEDIISLANEKSVHIHNIGLGNITGEPLTVMQNIADQTQGKFYTASSSTDLESNFQQLLYDLDGNYMISYITPQTETFTVSVSLTYDGITTTDPITDEVDGAAIYDDNRKGLIEFKDLIFENNSVEFDIYAKHIPRDISELRFKIDLNKIVEITKLDYVLGGLLENWSDPVLDENNFYNTSGDVLNFGDSGYFFHVKISNVTETGIEIPISFDNSIYPDEVYFYGGDAGEVNTNELWQTSLYAGFALGNPTPINYSTEIDTTDIELAWELFNSPDSTITTFYTVYLDTVTTPTTNFIQDITETSTAVDSLSALTEYFWRVKAVQGTNTTMSNTWSFTTAGPIELDIINPVPPDSATNIVPNNLELSWEVTNVPDDTLDTSYKVFLDTANPPTTTLIEGLSETYTTVDSLADSTQYFWKVEATHGEHVKSGNIWNFTTDQ